MKKYIQESASSALKNRKESYILSGQIPVHILNKLSPNLDLNQIIKSLEENIPKSILSLIEGIYIGDFKELKDRNIQAMFKDGVIYLSSFKEVPGASEELIAGNICHELAHAVEDNFGHEIYADERIENEYNGKKQKLFKLLAHEGYHFPKEMFFDERLVDELDELLYKEIGYDKLSLIIPGLFTSPYSITSIREYFANGMEDYLLGDHDHLRDISPVLYNKIEDLLDESL
jgi:hypothetical protein